MKFKVSAMDATGMEVTEVIEAPTKDEAQAEMRRNGMFVTKIDPQTEQRPENEVMNASHAKWGTIFSEFRQFPNIARLACLALAALMIVPVWQLGMALLNVSATGTISFICGFIAALIGDFCHRKMFKKD